MIQEAQKQIIIETFGPVYTPPLIDRLTKNKIYNSKGRPFSQSSIRMIVCGNKPNIAIEKEIMKITIAEKQEQKQLKEQLSA